MRPLSLAGEIPLYQGNLGQDIQKVMRNQAAERITGGLSFTSKMPCPSWGISAFRCRVGSVLSQKPGTTCADCYALKGRYLFPAVQAKLERRYQGLFHELWTPSMVFLVRWYADLYFRFFDSGDLQGVNHLKNIVTIAENVPQVQFWLPTREIETVRAVLREITAFPRNLTVRVSAARIDGKPPKMPLTSIVTTEPADGAFDCPSRDQGGGCGECRACWDPEVGTVAYRLH